MRENIKIAIIVVFLVILCSISGCSRQKQIADAHMLSIILDIASIGNDSITTTVVKNQEGADKDEEIILNFADPEELSNGLKELPLTEGDRIRVLYFKIKNVDNIKIIEIPDFQSHIGTSYTE